jgi:hypothetical protein
VSFFFNAVSCAFTSFSGRSGVRYFSCSVKGHVFVVIAEGWLEFLQDTTDEFAFGDILVEIDHDSQLLSQRVSQPLRNLSALQ